MRTMACRTLSAAVYQTGHREFKFPNYGILLVNGHGVGFDQLHIDNP